MVRGCAVLALTVAAFAACRSNPDEHSKVDRAAAVRLTQPFPVEPFEATDLDGRRVATADWKGQVIVVNVWATWCAPCRRELPMLVSLQSRHADRVRVLGLLQDKVTDEFARQFLKAAAVTFPVVRSTFEIEQRLPTVLVIPMTFVIDANGQLVSTFAGEADAADLEREVTRLLSGT
jgi:thiol-disulfide isomerase/thioredoxin